MRFLAAFLSLFMACDAAAQAPDPTGLRARLRGAEAPAPADLYADEKASDLARIGAEAPVLFQTQTDRTAAIALFVGDACASCASARMELAELAARLGMSVAVFDTRDPNHAAMMARLTLDTVPSYVMADKLIRGHMPAFVLERYLKAALGQ